MNSKSSEYKACGVTIESTSEGLYVKYNDTRAGPFKTVKDIDSIEVARKIGAEPKEVFLAEREGVVVREIRPDYASQNMSTVWTHQQGKMERLQLLPMWQMRLRGR